MALSEKVLNFSKVFLNKKSFDFCINNVEVNYLSIICLLFLFRFYLNFSLN